MKLFLKIRFNGTGFSGYQVQRNARTVQGELNRATADLFGYNCDICGCSRTDAGVHAEEFFITVSRRKSDELLTDIDLANIPRALNVRLPEDISVVSASYTDGNFHPRYAVKKKTYVYRILNSPERDPFLLHRVWHYPKRIDNEGIKEMNDAAKRFVGTFDFSSFMAAGSKIEDATRTVYGASVTTRGSIIEFRVAADGFLYNMVRIMCGTLLEIGIGKREASDISYIIEKKDRRFAGATAPAEGLYLEHVEY